jgi:MFS family permease
MWLTSFSGMILANIMMTTLSGLYASRGDVGLGYGVVVVLFIYDAVFNIACNPLIYCYMVEILPFYMRAKATAVAVSWSSALLVFNSYVNSIALDAIGWRYYLVYLGLLFLWLAIVYFFYPETKGIVLEGVAVQFEGEKAAVAKAGISPETVVEQRPSDPDEKSVSGVEVKSV